MKRFFAIALASLFLLTAAASAEQTVLEINWNSYQGKVLSGEVGPNPDVPGEKLIKVSAESAQVHAPILEIENPGITSPRWAIVGKLAHGNIAPEGFLEMWSYFSESEYYFSRTAAPEGPMKKLVGNQNWRDFVIMFSSEPGKMPTKISFGTFVPQGGFVYLSNLKLVQYSLDENPLLLSFGGWWNEMDAGIWGGLFGLIIGCIGGFIGWHGSKGQSKDLVMFLVRVCFVAGVAAFGLGLYALEAGQPYEVYYPLLLSGGLVSLIIGVNYKNIKRRYEEKELRKMQATDAG